MDTRGRTYIKVIALFLIVFLGALSLVSFTKSSFANADASDVDTHSQTSAIGPGTIHKIFVSSTKEVFKGLATRILCTIRPVFLWGPADQLKESACGVAQGVASGRGREDGREQEASVIGAFGTHTGTNAKTETANPGSTSENEGVFERFDRLAIATGQADTNQVGNQGSNKGASQSGVIKKESGTFVAGTSANSPAVYNITQIFNGITAEQLEQRLAQLFKSSPSFLTSISSQSPYQSSSGGYSMSMGGVTPETISNSLAEFKGGVDGELTLFSEGNKDINITAGENGNTIISSRIAIGTTSPTYDEGKNLSISGIFSSDQGSLTSFTKSASNGWENVIDVKGEYIYFTNTDNASFQIYRILNGVANLVSATSTGAGYNGLVVQGKYAYVFGDNLRIYDVSSPASPKLVSQTGSSWGFVTGAISGNYLTMANDFGGWGAFVTYDVSDPLNVRRVSGAGTVSAGQIKIIGHTLFALSHSRQDMRIFDISNPINPIQLSVISGISTSNWTFRDFRVQNGYLYAPYNSGLKIYDISNLTSPTLVSTTAYPSLVSESVEIIGNYLYIGSYSTVRKIVVYDVSNPAAPVLVGEIATPQSLPYAMGYSGSNLVVANMESGKGSIQVIPVGGIYSPSFEGGGASLGKLYVKDEGYFMGKLDVLGGGSFIGSLSTAGSFTVIGTTTSSQAPVFVVNSAGFVGIGTSSPIARLTLQGSVTATTTNLFRIASSSNAVYLNVSPNGQIGVGTTTSASLITVQGNSLSPSATLFNIASSTGSSLFNVLSNGNVGIGTTTPNGLLELRSTSNARLVINRDGYWNGSPADIKFVERYDQGNYWTLGMKPNSTSNFYLNKSGTDYITVLTTGNVGIGTSTPGQKLVVAGTIQSTDLLGGATTLSTDANGNIIRTPSDQKLKTNVETLTSSLDKVKQLRGVSYKWIDEARFGSSSEIGLIAQEVQGVVPEVVKDGGDYLSVNYQNLVALLIEAIKEIATKIEGFAEHFTSKFIKGDEIETNTLCITKGTDEKVCINGDQLYQLLNQTQVTNSTVSSQTEATASDQVEGDTESIEEVQDTIETPETTEDGTVDDVSGQNGQEDEVQVDEVAPVTAEDTNTQQTVSEESGSAETQTVVPDSESTTVEVVPET